MVIKKIYFILGISTLLFCGIISSCIPTYRAKSSLPYYKKERTEIKEYQGLKGFYYSKGKWGENSNFYYVRFFNSKGKYIAYLIKNSTSANFNDKLKSIIMNNTSPETWGAYIIEGDTLKLQTTPYKSKHNFFTTIPSSEHVYYIDGQDLIYQYSFSLKEPRKGIKFIASNNYPIIFKESLLHPNYEILGLEQ
jgi:hypothetical protein